ncbi:MAG TPA: large conductance mechanosensitive channel protein MscL [Acidobacteriaceae bacterium]|nr:large conductance mechanosensitive channel protein MscL [Acidobacteriaceae bacterium]
MLKGFRDFILRGNVVDLAVAVVIGAAFTTVVNSLVADLINPLISALVKKPDFSFLIWHLHGGAIKYGNFLNAVIAFVIVAAAIYYGVVLPLNKLMARMKRSEPVAAITTKPCPECLSDIPLAARRCSHCAQPVG